MLKLNTYLPTYHSEGAYYLAGYVAELTLKARICKLLDMDDFYASSDARKMGGAHFTHDPKQLLTLSGWRKRLEDEMGPLGVINAKLYDNWQTICQWSEHKRYDLIVNQVDAQAMLDALTDSSNGFLV